MALSPLEKTIQSVKKLKYKNVEYIIIDGGSKKKSIDVLKRNGLEIMAHKLDSDAMIIAIQLLQLEAIEKLGKRIK